MQNVCSRGCNDSLGTVECNDLIGRVATHTTTRLP